MYSNDPQAPITFSVSDPTGERGVFLLQHQWDACRPVGLHQLLGTSISHEEQVHTIVTDLALALLELVEALFHPVLDCSIFLP